MSIVVDAFGLPFDTDETVGMQKVAGYIVTKLGRVTAKMPLHKVTSYKVYSPEEQPAEPVNRKRIKGFSSQYVDATVMPYKVANGEVMVDQYADEPEPIADMYIEPPGVTVINLDN